MSLKRDELKLLKRLAWFVQTNGHGHVPDTYPKDEALGAFCARLRWLYGSGTHLALQLAADQAGLVWNDRDEVWRGYFRRLEAYSKRHGHTTVPRHLGRKEDLGGWVSKQRSQLSQGTLKPLRKQRLLALGFDANVPAARWEAFFSQAEKYARRHRGLRGLTARQVSPRVLKWLYLQRAQQLCGRLTNDQARRLRGIGFDFTPQAAKDEVLWQAAYKRLVSFRRDHGHILVKPAADLYLARWVGKQRVLLRKGRLHGSRAKLLKALGVFSPALETRWERNILELRRRLGPLGLHEHGYTKRLAGTNLGPWVAWLRKTWWTLPAKKRLALQRLGAVPARESRNALWRRRLEELRAYKRANGHLRVPANYQANRSLGIWVHRQLTYLRRGSLEAKKKAALKALGVMW